MEFLDTVFSVFTPFITGLIIAFILYLPCKNIEKLIKKVKKNSFAAKHARGISVLSVYILFVALISIILATVIPWLVNSAKNLYANSSDYYKTIVEFINARCDDEGKLFGLISVDAILNRLQPENIFSNFNFGQIATIAGSVLKAGSAVIDVILAIFSSVYILMSRASLVGSLCHFLTLFKSKEQVQKLYEYIRKIVNIFHAYIYSTIIDALIVGSACSIVFLIIGIDYAFLLGFAIGVANLIPYFGAFIAGTIVAVFTAVTSGIDVAIVVAVSILIIQQIDANVLQPRIVGQSVGIQPLLTLFAITVGGGWFGFAGIILSVPIAATLKMIITDIIAAHEKATEAKEADENAEQLPLPTETEVESQEKAD